MGARNRVGTGLWLLPTRDGIFKLLRGPGIDYASLFSLTGRYDNSIPARFPAPIDCSQIPAHRARIFKFLRNPSIDSNEPIPPGCLAFRAGTTTLFLYSVPSPHRLL
jgi:hypothetical protein